MKAISFGWTTPPLLAGVKSVTRREWKDAHAARHHAGDRLYALDKDYRYGGGRIAVVRLTADPVKEPSSMAPASDYVAEGFAWFEQHPHLLPANFRKRLVLDESGQLTRRAFQRWLSGDHVFWVVRFAVEEWLVDPATELARLEAAAAS